MITTRSKWCALDFADARATSSFFSCPGLAACAWFDCAPFVVCPAQTLVRAQNTATQKTTPSAIRLQSAEKNTMRESPARPVNIRILLRFLYHIGILAHRIECKDRSMDLL